MATTQQIREVEVQTIERIKRALGHEKSSKKDFISLDETRKCRISIGLNKCLKTIQKDEAAVIILPQRVPETTHYAVSELAKVKNIPIWSPIISSHGFGRRLNLPSPCQIVVLSNHVADTLDAFGSIRDYIIKDLLSDTVADDLEGGEGSTTSHSNKRQRRS